MLQKFKYFIVFTLVLVFSAVVFSANQKMPDFQLLDLNKETVSVREITNQYELTFICLITSWCHYCGQEMDAFDKLMTKYPNKDFKILTISLDRSSKAPTKLMKKKNYSFQMIMGNNEVSGFFKVRGVPVNIYVAKNGNILDVKPGYVPIETIEQIIQGLPDRKREK